MSDILVCPFSIPSQEDMRAVAQPLEIFKAPPIVRGTQMAGCTDFTELGVCKQSDAQRFTDGVAKLRNPVSGRLLPNLLRAFHLDQEAGRIGLISFSAGRAASQQILQADADRRMIDTVIDLDGLHFSRLPQGIPQSQIDPWFQFGQLALDGSHLMVLAHTAIVPNNANQIYSTTESNGLLFDELEPVAAVDNGRRTMVYDAAGLTYQAGKWPAHTPEQGGDVARTYTSMPALTIRTAGNSFSIAMPGATAGYHIFCCNYLQGAIMRAFLAPRWNNECAFASAAASFAAPTAAPPTVIVYTGPGCGYCTQAKAYLTSKGVPFQELDYQTNQAAADARLAAFGVKPGGVPVIDFGNAVQLGFVASSVDAALAGRRGGSASTATCLPTTSFNIDDVAEDTGSDDRWNTGSIPSIFGGDEAPAERDSLGLYIVGGLIVGTLGFLIYRSATKRKSAKRRR